MISKGLSYFLSSTIWIVGLLFFSILIQDVEPEQSFCDYPYHEFPDTLANSRYDLDSLKKRIGENKILAPGYEVQSALALTAFPELEEVSIEFVMTDYGAPMESSVDPWSLIGLRRNRKYQILLNDATGSFFDPILLRNLPFDAQVGILAHELGHTVYYHNLNLLEFAQWGLCYAMDNDFRAKHERSTDLMPVLYGLGHQIYQYAYFVRKDSSCAEFYEQDQWFMDTFYMSDEELLPYLEK